MWRAGARGRRRVACGAEDRGEGEATAAGEKAGRGDSPPGRAEREDMQRGCCRVVRGVGLVGEGRLVLGLRGGGEMVAEFWRSSAFMPFDKGGKLVVYHRSDIIVSENWAMRTVGWSDTLLL